MRITKDMTMDVKAEIEMKYSVEEYTENFEALGEQITDAEINFREWVEPRFNELKAIYIERFVENDLLVLSMAWDVWSRFMFNISNYNKVRDEQFNKEMKDLLG
jgi:hypothetical protein